MGLGRPNMVSRAVENVVFAVERASMLVRVTPLMDAFFLRFLLSVFFSVQHAYLVIIFFLT